MMTREHFEQLAEPILARLRAPMEAALRESNLTVDDISSVEVVGSSTRMPAVCRIVEDVFKKVWENPTRIGCLWGGMVLERSRKSEYIRT